LSNLNLNIGVELHVDHISCSQLTITNNFLRMIEKTVHRS